MNNLTPQTTLTNDAPLILDATCSYAKIWPPYASIRMDIRKNVKPDIVADARYLPFREGVFDVIYCDPPHLIQSGPRVEERKSLEKIHAATRLSGRLPSSEFFERYGFWLGRESWLDFVTKTNDEFAYVLKDGVGLLYYKITDGISERGPTGGTIKLRELIMPRFVIIKDRVTKSGSRRARKGTMVHWLTMKLKSNEKLLEDRS